MTLFKKMRLYFKLLYQFLCSYKGAVHAGFLSDDECVDDILLKRKSFIRYGDGEFDIIEGKSIHYQEYDPNLAKCLDKIIHEYLDNSDECNYLVGMPREYFNRKGLFMLHSRQLMSCWSHARYFFKKNYDVDVQYGNAHLFAKGNEIIYEKIWKESPLKKIVFVHNDRKWAERFENQYKIRCEYVGIPKENAYMSLDDIYKNIIKYSDKETTMILISAGPCGKVLTYLLSKEGYWAIDTGHCWDEPLIIQI